MKLYVVVLEETFPRGDCYTGHIRAYESKKRAENYAKKIKGSKVVEFVPKEKS